MAREVIKLFVEGYNMADLEDRLLQHEFTMEKIEKKQNRPVPRCNRSVIHQVTHNQFTTR